MSGSIPSHSRFPDKIHQIPRGLRSVAFGLPGARVSPRTDRFNQRSLAPPWPLSFPSERTTSNLSHLTRALNMVHASPPLGVRPRSRVWQVCATVTMICSRPRTVNPSCWKGCGAYTRIRTPERRLLLPEKKKHNFLFLQILPDRSDKRVAVQQARQAGQASPYLRGRTTSGPYSPVTVA